MMEKQEIELQLLSHNKNQNVKSDDWSFKQNKEKNHIYENRERTTTTIIGDARRHIIQKKTTQDFFIIFATQSIQLKKNTTRKKS